MHHQQNNNMTHDPLSLLSITESEREKKKDGARKQKSHLERDSETVKSIHIWYLSFYNNQVTNKRIWILNSHDKYNLHWCCSRGRFVHIILSSMHSKQAACKENLNHKQKFEKQLPMTL